MKPLALLLSLASLALAQEFRIGGGLVTEQVLQRDSTNKATAKVIGTAFGLDGTSVEARITAGRRVVRNWSAVGKVENGAWAVDLTAIPMGGPYRIELRAGPTQVAAVDDILVGDLWVLAGQSNMEGVGDLTDVQPSDPKVHSFDLTDNWLIAKEPLHTLVSATDRVHWP